MCDDDVENKKGDIMKKTLLATTLLVAFACTTATSQAFEWRNLNPANWGTCPKCEKVCKKEDPCKPKCKCKKQKCSCKPKCDPCEKKITTPCNPCQTPVAPCDPCDKLQEVTEQ